MISQYQEMARLLWRHQPSARSLRHIQLKKLRALLNHAGKRVPYYRRLFDSAKIRPEDIRSAEHLRQLPITTRDHLLDAGPDRMDQKVETADCLTLRTSGSSGKPLEVYLTPAEVKLRRALELRSIRSAGVRPRDQIATLGPREATRQILGRLGLYRVTSISPLISIEEQARQLADIQPEVLWVYPTALRTLLQHVQTLSTIIQPRLIISSAEPLDDVLKKNLQADQPYDIRNFYGSMELGRIAWDCGSQTGLHINCDSCIVELEGDTDVPDGGQSVVVTNLDAFASPFIRYRLGDLSKLIDQPCPCGSRLPLMTPPTGRDWDILQLPSGKLISPWGFNAIFRQVKNLQQFRLIQEHTDLLVLQLKFVSPTPKAVLKDLHTQLLQHIDEPVTLRIELVDRFENESLKFRAFISKLSKQ